MRPASQPDRITRPIRDWDELITHLHRWVEQHGTSRVPQAATVELDDGTAWPLGLRVKVIRQRHSRGTLDPWYVHQLEQLPGWRWTVRRRHDPAAPSYREMPQEWLDRHDQVLQTLTAGHRPGPNDLAWLRLQRDNARKGRLTAEQTRLLETLDTTATRTGLARPYGTARTATFATTLTKWMREHGIHDVGKIPFRTALNDPDGHPQSTIGSRIAYYRSRYAGRESPGSLSTEEIQLLEAIPGWTWTPSRGPYASDQ